MYKLYNKTFYSVDLLITKDVEVINKNSIQNLVTLHTYTL